jgi:hypothetical protein
MLDQRQFPANKQSQNELNNFSTKLERKKKTAVSQNEDIYWVIMFVIQTENRKVVLTSHKVKMDLEDIKKTERSFSSPSFKEFLGSVTYDCLVDFCFVVF